MFAHCHKKKNPLAFAEHAFHATSVVAAESLLSSPVGAPRRLKRAHVISFFCGEKSRDYFLFLGKALLRVATSSYHCFHPQPTFRLIST